jgi:hypothetical protein
MTVRETNNLIPAAGGLVDALPSNGNRLGLIYANNSTGVLNFSATHGMPASATVGIPVKPGETFQFGGNAIAERGRVPHGPVSVWGAGAGSAGQPFYIAETD